MNAAEEILYSDTLEQIECWERRIRRLEANSNDLPDDVSAVDVLNEINAIARAKAKIVELKRAAGL